MRKPIGYKNNRVIKQTHNYLNNDNILNQNKEGSENKENKH